jgi:membrane protease YdiL (CAAX protease family)
MPPTRKRTDWLHLGNGKTYAHRVHQPLQCLIFITPLLLFYQIASTIHPGTIEQGYNSPPQHVVAFILMLKFFAFFGAAGNVLPLAAVVAILLFWHLARKDPWDFDPKLYLGMAGESIVWGIPFFIIGLAVARHVITHGYPTMAAAGSPLSWQTEVVLSVGAGIYEELLFRLIAITTLNIILVDIFEMSIQWAIPIIILASAILFSAYHYLGNEPFSAATFAFRSALGVYLAGIYIYRGFGITVGAHTVYDLFVVSFMHMQH